MNQKTVCRVCRNNLMPEALFILRNAPAQAQNFPDENSLSSDKGIDIKVGQCEACGLVQLFNEPVSYHREVIRAIAVSGDMKLFREKQFADFLVKFSLLGKNILEVGSGKGEFLSLMNQAGGRAFGIEGSADSVAYGVSQKLSMQHLYLETGEEIIPEGPFDGFFIMSYLEHMPKPMNVLKGLSKNLKEGAVGIVEVPNFDMMVKENQFSEFTTDHLYYFSEKTLRTTLESGGFEVLEVKPVWHDYILSAVVKKRKKLSLDQMNDSATRLITAIDEHLSGNSGKRFAVWGAGHQSLTILSMLNNIKAISCVIDSAPFKQDKYTPASHVKIVGPEKIYEFGITDIVVVAGSYSSEVCRIVREKHPQIRLSVVKNTEFEIL